MRLANWHRHEERFDGLAFRKGLRRCRRSHPDISIYEVTVLVPDELRKNAFRVLRLPASATLSEMHKAAASMRRSVALGLIGTIAADIPSLGEVPRTELSIRAAMDRLAIPISRLTDRLFWFNIPGQSEGAPADSKLGEQLARDHGQALHGLFIALDADLDDAGIEVWVKALRVWHSVVSGDAYWALASTIEAQGGFEPTALQSELDALRGDSVRLAAEPLAVAGRDALARNDAPRVHRILGALEQLADTGSWAAIAHTDIIAPPIERLRALCVAIREECGSKIVREQKAAERNGPACDLALKRFRTEIEPAFNSLAHLVSPSHTVVQQAREEIALCLNAIATDFTWADDFIVSEQLQEEALKLAEGTLGAIRIEGGLDEVRESARRQRVLAELEPISSAPSLGTVNGFGSTLYGASDYDADTNSYVTTHYFVALFFPIFPVGRYRVIRTEDKGYRFLGRLPLRKADRWHTGIAAAAILAVFLGGILNSNRSTSSPSTNHRNGANYGSNGYVPGELSSVKATIESGRSQMEVLRSRLEPIANELRDLDTRQENIGSELRVLDGQHSAGLDIDIDDYNAKVELHNALLARRRRLFEANSGDFQAYGELERQDSVLVERYNSLLR